MDPEFVINHPCRFGGKSTFDLLRCVSIVALVSYKSSRSFQRVRAEAFVEV